jgi:hypothetical protein
MGWHDPPPMSITNCPSAPISLHSRPDRSPLWLRETPRNQPSSRVSRNWLVRSLRDHKCSRWPLVKSSIRLTGPSPFGGSSQTKSICKWSEAPGQWADASPGLGLWFHQLASIRSETRVDLSRRVLDSHFCVAGLASRGAVSDRNDAGLNQSHRRRFPAPRATPSGGTETEERIGSIETVSLSR